MLKLFKRASVILQIAIVLALSVIASFAFGISVDYQPLGVMQKLAVGYALFMVIFLGLLLSNTGTELDEPVYYFPRYSLAKGFIVFFTLAAGAVIFFVLHNYTPVVHH